MNARGTRVAGWLLGLLLLLGVAGGVFATPAPDDQNVIARYAKLFDALDSGNSIDRVLQRETWPEDDLLASYVELELLLHPRYKATLPRLKAFLERWPAHPQRYRLDRLMDLRILKHGSDAEILAWFDQRPPRFSSARIRYMELLLKNKRLTEAKALFREHYRSGGHITRSLDRQMDRFRGLLQQADHEARARVLVRKGYWRTLHTTIKALPAKRRTYYQAMEAARRARKAFNTLIKRLDPELRTDSGLWWARIEGLRRNGYRLKALDLLQGKEGGYLDEEARQSVRYRLGRDFLFQDDDPESAFVVLDPNVQEMGGELDDSLWLAAFSAHLKGDRLAALERFTRLAREARDIWRRSQGAFWAARELHQAGMDDTLWLEEGAKYPDTFYGLLAAQQLGRPLPPAMPENWERECDALLARPELAPGLARLERLRAAGRSQHNNDEIETLAETHHLTRRQQICLAQRYDAANLSVKLSRKVRQESGELLWDGLYPLPQKWSPDKGWKLSPSTVWGTVRQESLFHHRVESPAKARGLMQLIPPTARKEAQILRMPRSTRHRLQDPGYNLSLGQSYLYRLLESFDGDLVLSLAGYNAGPHRAKKWSGERQHRDPYAFIELIPFTETRHYVKRVSHGIAAYRLRMGGNPEDPSLARLVAGGGPPLSDFLATADH